jgi:hypothetical protein
VGAVKNPFSEIFIMDNVSSPLVSSASCVIKLDQFQYMFYQQSRLEIHSPKGKFLTAIAQPFPNKTEEDEIYQLWYQACLLEVLFEQMQGRVQLTEMAINVIATIIDRIDLHLKKQGEMQKNDAAD